MPDPGSLTITLKVENTQLQPGQNPPEFAFPQQTKVGDAATGPGPIFVTGASSGIDRTITEFRSTNRNIVFAGARKERDLKALSQLPNVTALRLDVTKTEDVQEVVNWLHDQGKGIYGLVSNAGVGIIGPLIDQSVEDLDRSRLFLARG